jgi:hypothetical protein
MIMKSKKKISDASGLAGNIDQEENHAKRML